MPVAPVARRTMVPHASHLTVDPPEKVNRRVTRTVTLLPVVSTIMSEARDVPGWGTLDGMRKVGTGMSRSGVSRGPLETCHSISPSGASACSGTCREPSRALRVAIAFLRSVSRKRRNRTARSSVRSRIVSCSTPRRASRAAN